MKNPDSGSCDLIDPRYSSSYTVKRVTFIVDILVVLVLFCQVAAVHIPFTVHCEHTSFLSY
jgi:hypothetical protein